MSESTTSQQQTVEDEQPQQASSSLAPPTAEGTPTVVTAATSTPTVVITATTTTTPTVRKFNLSPNAMPFTPSFGGGETGSAGEQQPMFPSMSTSSPTTSFEVFSSHIHRNSSSGGGFEPQPQQPPTPTYSVSSSRHTSQARGGSNNNNVFVSAPFPDSPGVFPGGGNNAPTSSSAGSSPQWTSGSAPPVPGFYDTNSSFARSAGNVPSTANLAMNSSASSVTTPVWPAFSSRNPHQQPPSYANFNMKDSASGNSLSDMNTTTNTFTSGTSPTTTNNSNGAMVPPFKNFGKVSWAATGQQHLTTTTTTTTSNSTPSGSVSPSLLFSAMPPRPSPSTITTGIPKSPSGSSCSSARSSLTANSGVVAAQAAAFPSMPSRGGSSRFGNSNSQNNLLAAAAPNEDWDEVVFVKVSDAVWRDHEATDRLMRLGYREGEEDDSEDMGFFEQDPNCEFIDEDPDGEFEMLIASPPPRGYGRNSAMMHHYRPPSVMTDAMGPTTATENGSIVGTQIDGMDDLDDLDEDQMDWIEQQLAEAQGQNNKNNSEEEFRF